MSYSHEANCKYLNWTAYTLRITGWFFPQHMLLQLCRKRWWGHLHVNLQTEPIIHQDFLNKELFPNRPSSPNILMQCCVERSVWPLPEYQAVRACAASIHPQPCLAHLSHEQPHSTLLTHGKCPRSVRDFTKKSPQMWRGWEAGERNRRFGNNLFKFLFAVTISIWCN